MKKNLLKTLVLALACSLLMGTAYAQKIHVWKPKSVGVGARSGYNKSDTINVVIYDTRKFPAKAKLDCSSGEVIAEVAKAVRQAFSGATVRIFNTSNYKNPMANHITVRIGIGAFSVGFGADARLGIGSAGHRFGAFPEGQWTAVASFYVRAYDRRNRDDFSFEKEVYKTESKKNLLGLTTARRALDQVWPEAIPALMVAIDNGLKKK